MWLEYQRYKSSIRQAMAPKCKLIIDFSIIQNELTSSIDVCMFIKIHNMSVYINYVVMVIQ